jgi:deazaflavin-dependent oxidoreductase (nitroreductase family)
VTPPPLQKLARYIGRLPWLAKMGRVLVHVDLGLQRTTRGRVSFGSLAGLTSVVLTTTGRTTGQPRKTPLIAVPDGDDLLIVGSNWGRPNHPAWSGNLLANPRATVEVRGRAFPVTATLLTGTERERAWALVTEVWPAYSDYAARAGREIRIFRASR